MKFWCDHPIQGERQKTARKNVEHRQRKTEAERESLRYSKIDRQEGQKVEDYTGKE